ncbi:phosphatase PAP2 family protein [Curtobacterium sp. ISL-83]|uniref:phosphatase PAP2 family protein n=1 Tax=Curtobacterium sp. ISL-83 TaxID=2819145 RepID=UPI001BE5D2DB|nr:phosphatase PAP2 family protein [Curtobacterium sp. ISL-83]MBT2501036.1 phosphatase PAP2 family protein [Curtobacterium sp. ISL-83]
MDQPASSATPETSDRFVADRDVTNWTTPVGRTLAQEHRKLSERLGAHGALIVSLTVGGAISVATAYSASRIFAAVSGSTGIQSLDAPILAAAKRLRSPALDATAATIAHVFGPVGMPLMTLAAGGVLSARGRTRTPLTLLVAAGTGSLLMTLSGKDMIKRNRPAKADAISPYETSPSFPSGHTLNATTIAGTLAYLLMLRQKSKFRQGAVAAAAAGTAAGVGLSRVLLGAHWFTDVLVGWTTGSGWLGLVITSHRLYLTSRRAGVPAEAPSQR